MRNGIQGTDNVVIDNKVALDNVVFDIRGNGNMIHLSENVILNDTSIRIYGNGNKIYLKENMAVESNIMILMEGNENYLEIGKKTTLLAVNFVLADGSRIILGDDCMCSYDVHFRTSDQHSIIDGGGGGRINWEKDIIIKDHVWFCANTRIQKGVTIAHETVVGLGAIVTKPILEPNVVVAGNPAKIVKKNINWLRERIQKMGEVIHTV
ncbi:MAG: acyltransferase [Treponema sp.]|jgi:acetyltransferase-like isoleucine patch superfamily enzyme|nr:acyltransferase [Treponema sp.]